MSSLLSLYRAPYLGETGKHIATGERVALVRKVAPVGQSFTWEPGARVEGNTGIQPGTAIAVFERRHGANQHGMSRAGTCLGQARAPQPHPGRNRRSPRSAGFAGLGLTFHELALGVAALAGRSWGAFDEFAARIATRRCMGGSGDGEAERQGNEDDTAHQGLPG